MEPKFIKVSDTLTINAAHVSHIREHSGRCTLFMTTTAHDGVPATIELAEGEAKALALALAFPDGLEAAIMAAQRKAIRLIAEQICGG